MASRLGRFRLKILMTMIGVIAIGLALMRNGSEMAAKATFHVLLAALMLALLGAIARRGDGAWVGFALFGWAYAVFAFVPAVHGEFGQRLVTEDLLREIVPRLKPGPGPEPSPPLFASGYVFKLRDWERDLLRDRYPGLDEMNVVLPPDELKTLKVHLEDLHSHEKLRDAWSDSVGNAMEIGHSLLAFVAALSGSILGRALAHRPTLVAGSNESETANLHG